jgi:hypothetical protein
MGYKQELRRNFTMIEVFGIAVSTCFSFLKNISSMLGVFASCEQAKVLCWQPSFHTPFFGPEDGLGRLCIWYFQDHSCGRYLWHIAFVEAANISCHPSTQVAPLASLYFEPALDVLYMLIMHHSSLSWAFCLPLLQHYRIPFVRTPKISHLSFLFCDMSRVIDGSSLSHRVSTHA